MLVLLLPHCCAYHTYIVSVAFLDVLWVHIRVCRRVFIRVHVRFVCLCTRYMRTQTYAGELSSDCFLFDSLSLCLHFIGIFSVCYSWKFWIGVFCVWHRVYGWCVIFRTIRIFVSRPIMLSPSLSNETHGIQACESLSDALYLIETSIIIQKY